MDFSIVIFKNSENILQELTFFKAYLVQASVIPEEIDRELHFHEVDSLHNIPEEDFSSFKSDTFIKTLDSLIAFLSYRDPIFKIIGIAINSLTSDDLRKEKATAMVEGMLWLLHLTLSKYNGRYNSEIANLAKAGVSCANILYHADLLPDPNY